MMVNYFYYRTEKSQEPIQNLFLFSFSLNEIFFSSLFLSLSLSHPIECKLDISQTFFKPSVCVCLHIHIMSSIFPNWLTEAMLLHRKGYGSEQMNGDITCKKKKKDF
jgi:hypothetical protein